MIGKKDDIQEKDRRFICSDAIRMSGFGNKKL